MKLSRIVLTIVFGMSFVSMCYAQTNKTTFKGSVNNWHTDTVYLQTMPFHSPFSNELKFQNLSADSVFQFNFEDADKPFVVQIFSKKEHVESNKEELLFLNLTDKYYYGHCIKFYTHGVATFLIEPGTTLDVNLTNQTEITHFTSEAADRWRKRGVLIPLNNILEYNVEMKIQFVGDNSFQNNYYQESFDLDNDTDQRLELYYNKPIEKAITSYNKIRKKLLKELETNKEKLSPVFYDYIKAEIEFGARKEFLKYLEQENSKEKLDIFFSNEISGDIMDIIEFDKSKINYATIINEEYCKYLELYINFKMNIQNKEYIEHNDFSLKKGKTAFEILPEESAYYYLANQLLQTIRTEDVVIELIQGFPDGELNDKLIKMYDL